MCGEYVGQLQTSSKTDDEFDYAKVPPSVASFLRGQAQRIRRCAATSVVKIGKDLIAAKHYLSHGEFHKWLETEVGIPARSAQGYMQVAEWVTGKSATIAHSSPSLLYILSSPSTPEELTFRIIKQVEAGERVKIAPIREELRALRHAKRQGRDDQALATEVTVERHDAAATVFGSGASETITEVLSILANGLSVSDFTCVRAMMTSKQVLDDRNLAKHIVSAFAKIDSLGKEQQLLAKPSQVHPPTKWEKSPEVATH